MEIIYRNIDELKPYENNPRHNKLAVDKVAESIKEFGFKNPIIIDRNDVIVCGHTRLEAAKKIEMKEVPCIMADDLTDEQIKAFRLADNKTAEFAEWDIDALNVELLDISDIDMSLFGFDVDLGENTEIVEDEVPEVNESTKPVSQLGDVWQLGNHRLMCGNSADPLNWSILMGGGKGAGRIY